MKKEYQNNSNPDSDWGIIETNKFKINPTAKKRVWIIDDFYKNPNDVREYALDQMYWDKHGAVGWRTRKQFIFEGIKEKIEETMGCNITKWADEYPVCGVFQAGFANAEGVPPQVYHCDDQQWAAMVYLTPDAPFETGTKIVANKENKIFHESQGEISEFFPQPETFCDGTLFENVDTYGNIYNRMIIFDGKYLHSSMAYFGHSIATGRLWQMFFFDADLQR